MSIKVNKDTRIGSIKQFSPDPKVFDGLCLGELVEVSKGSRQFKEDSESVAYRGKTLPRLTFHFQEITKDKSEPGHYFYNVDVPTPDTKYVYSFTEAYAQFIGHFADKFGMLDTFNLDIPIEKDKNYTGDQLADIYTKLIDYTVGFFNGELDGKGKKITNGKPIFKGKALAIKLLYYFKNKEVNNGNPGFPKFVGEGVIEVLRKTDNGYVKPSIKVNVAKGEDIVPKAKGATPAGIPAGGNAAAPAGGSLPSWAQE